MKNIKKGTEPNSLAKYRSSLQGDYSGDKVFDNYPEKNILKKQLLEEQGYICCYCMQRIKNNSNTKIEHFKPQSKYPQKKLDYNNLFSACNGVINTQEERKTGIRHCDTSKGDCESQRNVNCDLTIKPIDCEKYIIKYKTDGTIQCQEKLKKDIEEILNLNNNILKRNRQQILKAFIQEFNKNRKTTTWSSSKIQKKLEKYQSKDTAGKYRPYCQVVIYYLKKKLGIQN